MLTLPIKKEWFSMIATGIKKEEYRDKSAYYFARLDKYSDGKPFRIRFSAGYKRTSPLMVCVCTLHEGPGREEWGAAPGWHGYILKIEKVEVLLWF